MASRPVRTTYLELTDPARIRVARHPGPGVTFERLRRPGPELARFFYTAIGGDHCWIDRLAWTFADWTARLSAPGVESWVLGVDGAPAGLVELDAGVVPDVEIAMFGLLPAYGGRGLGAWMLERASRRGLALGRRIWLHTCELDAPAALANYLAGGLVAYREEMRETELPDRTPGPWPGAARPTA